MGKQRNSKNVSLTPLKITILGSVGVGKTSLLLSYKSSKFDSNTGNNFEPVALDYFKSFPMDGLEVPVVVSDSSARPEYVPLRHLTYKGTDCFLLCYSINNVVSFSAIEKEWIPVLKSHYKKVPYILVGTKADLRDTEKDYKLIPQEEGETQRKSIKAHSYLEISTKEMTGLDDMFTLAARTALNFRCNDKRASCVVS